ncbi:conserved Plasmodium protein, unknown function [Plasmodium ovale wallikeri]|uniref:Uncharacterized protein n=1 Tax=Plasmodium ovale wallikeri TaxID=864142 RepID=A0A1A8YNR1_PLAOA|nr:conserved Plasmodium protein, unknown function [Plasmodium ovale wallikeri]SBT33445.1 conserved Plasmodium protein, unknown function [Plasmodium ovale wallikeri]
MRLLCFFLFAYYILHNVKSNDDTYISLTEYEIKNKFSVRVLKKSRTKCGLAIGDKAEIQLRTFSPVVNNMPHMTSNNNFGYAEQTFIEKKNLRAKRKQSREGGRAALIPACKGSSKDAFKGSSKDAFKGAYKDAFKGAYKDAFKGAYKDAFKRAYKGTCKDAFKRAYKGTCKDAFKGTCKSS